MQKLLTREKALIFRIVHRTNLPWILDNGLHCANSATRDPRYVNIGNVDLISKRAQRVVEAPPGGTLSDYIPFYFTPRSPMLYNIKTGYNGIKRRENDEILILISSLHTLTCQNLPFLFTDRHAYLAAAYYTSNLEDLSRIDWTILQNSDFKRNTDDMGKFERYQAEALIHRHLPVCALLGIACHSNGAADTVNDLLNGRAANLKVVTRGDWYF